MYYYRILFSCITVFAVLTTLFISLYTTKTLRKPPRKRLTRPLEQVSNESRVILFYTPWFGNLPWPGINDNPVGLTDTSGRSCGVSSCRISTHREDFHRSHAVVFHGVSMRDELHEITGALYRAKPARQKWVWYEHENPAKVALSYDVNALNSRIDITATYRPSSDIFIPYGSFRRREEKGRKEPSRNYAEGKDKLVFWTVSNCKPKLRIKLVRRLAKFVRVDVFGQCSSSFYWFKRNCTRWSTACDSIRRRYKFAIALENHNCMDYLTEKYWGIVSEANMVPILVAGSYTKRYLIAGSYINLLDFPSATALGDYLLYLDGNDTAYSQYFSWKEIYEVDLWSGSWICKLCEIIHANVSKPPLQDFSAFWGTRENCYADDDYLYYKWLLSRAPARGMISGISVFVMAIFAYWEVT